MNISERYILPYWKKLSTPYAIHSNVRNLGLFFIYEKVGISK
jgi:hypothetical protein